MPYTAKQHRLFQAISHGWKPPASSGIHISKEDATKMAHEGVKDDPKEAKRKAQLAALRGNK